MTRRIRIVVGTMGAFAGAAIAAGCAGPRMAAPPGLAQGSEVLDVKDRSSMSGALVDESFELGPFKIAEVDRDWDSSSGIGVGEFSSKKTAGGYKFQLVNGKSSLVGKCATEAKEKSVGLGSGFSVGTSFAKLGCSCEAGGKMASVVVQGKGSGNGYEGSLTTSDGKYSVVSIHDTEGGGSQGDPAGYRAEGEGPLGAVEVLRPGRVWLKKGLGESERAETSCLFAGLMLYMPPKD